jgi:hypothetical protein
MYELLLTSFNYEKQDSGLREFMHIYEEDTSVNFPASSGNQT